MGRRLRYVPSGAMVEITSRTIQRRLLLKPTEELTGAILGILGRALAMYDVQLHAFAFVSNHFHLLASPADGEQLAAFVGYVKSQISREAGRLYDWPGTLWDRRYTSINVVDEGAQVGRLRYILAHGAKEGLVASPLMWPGAHCAQALVHGDPIIGTWTDRTALYDARRHARRLGHEIDEHEYQAQYLVNLAPLPCWRGFTALERRRRCAELVDEIEREAAEDITVSGYGPLGVAKILEQHPHQIPRTRPRKRNAPLVHATTATVRESFTATYRRFVDQFRRASQRLRRGERDARFPLYSFPPCLPYVGNAVVVT